MKSKKVIGLFWILTFFFYAFTCIEVYEDNSFITFQGKITDEFNQNITGFDLVFGQEVFDYRFEAQNVRFEFDSLENTYSRRIRKGKTDESGNFKFIHPAKFTSFYVYRNPQTLFRYLERGAVVERNYIRFERNQDTGKFSNEIKIIQIVIP